MQRAVRVSSRSARPTPIPLIDGVLVIGEELCLDLIGQPVNRVVSKYDTT